MMQDDDTDQDIGDDEGEGEREDTGETTLSSDIDKDNLDHPQMVLLRGQARREKSSRTTWVPLPKTPSRADTVIERPLLPNSRESPGSIGPPPLLKGQKSAHLNKSSESHRALSAQVLPQCKSSGDQNALRPKASAHQNVPQHQMATFEVAKMFMEAIIFVKTPWPILSDDKYSMVEEAWTLAIEAQDRQRALAGAPPGTLPVCQLPSSPSLKIDPQTREAVSFGLCLMLFYQIYDIDYGSNYT
jgi:hypothetical protein